MKRNKKVWNCSCHTPCDTSMEKQVDMLRHFRETEKRYRDELDTARKLLADSEARLEKQLLMAEHLRARSRRLEKARDALREENAALEQSLLDMRKEYLRRLTSLETL